MLLKDSSRFFFENCSLNCFQRPHADIAILGARMRLKSFCWLEGDFGWDRTNGLLFPTALRSFTWRSFNLRSGLLLYQLSYKVFSNFSFASWLLCKTFPTHIRSCSDRKFHMDCSVRIFTRSNKFVSSCSIYVFIVWQLRQLEWGGEGCQSY